MSCTHVLLARGRTHRPGVRTAHMALEPDLRNAAVVRRFVRERLAGRAESLVDDASLLATELVTNAIVHLESPIVVGVADDDAEILVVVADQRRDRVPLIGRMPSAEDVVEMSRGIALVCSIASDFGWHLLRDSPGKVVWFSLDVATGGPPTRA